MNRPRMWQPGQMVVPADITSVFRAHWSALKHLEQIGRRKTPVDASAARELDQEITDAWQVARFTSTRLAEMLRELGRRAECHEVDQYRIRLTRDGELEITHRPPVGRPVVYPRAIGVDRPHQETPTQDGAANVR
jgi:hypothetical protein